MKSISALAIVCSMSVALIAQTAPKIYKKQTDATTYHLADCPFIKKAGYAMVEATLEDTQHLDPCTICHPERNQALASAIDTFVAAKSARARAVSEKAKADAASKAVAITAEKKRKETEPVVRLTDQQLRPVVAGLVLKAKNDVPTFDAAFKGAIASLAPDYQGPVAIAVSPGLAVYALGPVSRLHTSAREAVRKFDPLPLIAWTNELQIIVSPSRIDSPDIEKVVVERNGAIVPPLRSTLMPHELETAMGAKKPIHSGDVVFPLAAFNNGAGATVKITLVPASGDNISRVFDSIALRGFQ